MKAVILLGTLKKEEISNTETLCEFLIDYLDKENIECSLIKLVEHNILPGTYNDMGKGDHWPKILKQMEAADIIIFATPIWWNVHSSEMQRVIERLDELHDEINEGKKSRFDGKVAGVVVTGDSDGAESLISNFGNFFNAIGLLFPPFSSLTVLSVKHSKGEKTPKKELLKFYEKEYADTATKFVKQMVKFSK
ncbi:flavodoxin family protein [Aequorivita sp. SDUM287046]|uniref:Flavodoxin family protein n=1 Tax=Aequorivita aurantiaca TaxID=3053356 RepID=A0ABT8DLM5_9FLAO|nr:flavodoxin family protein [Aequorivita aurantiaca]MDN3724924.1 flavodoxin family protein [Aequorivita aurantiaca]